MESRVWYGGGGIDVHKKPNDRQLVTPLMKWER